jgi:hypothetical protein
VQRLLRTGLTNIPQSRSKGRVCKLFRPRTSEISRNPGLAKAVDLDVTDFDAIDPKIAEILKWMNLTDGSAFAQFYPVGYSQAQVGVAHRNTRISPLFSKRHRINKPAGLTCWVEARNQIQRHFTGVLLNSFSSAGCRIS